MRRPLIAFVCLLSVCSLVVPVWLDSTLTIASAQESKSKAAKKKGSTNVLDVEATKIQGDFIKNAEQLAGDYFELKEYDKARMLLKSIQALEPDRENLEAKLKKLDDVMINSNETDIEVNSARSWEPTGIIATAGKPIRLKAEGNYQFAMTAQLGPAGFAAAKEPSLADMVNDLPVGALIGIVVGADKPGAAAQPVEGGQPVNKDDDKDKKKDRAFLVGVGCDYTAQKDGMLYLRINAPPENKNKGKVKVQISGGTSIGKGARQKTAAAGRSEE